MGRQELSLSQAWKSLWEQLVLCVDYMSLARQLAGKGTVETKAPRSPSQVRRGGETRSHAAQPVSFQQNLIKASNTVGRRFRADVSIAQRRLSAVKLDRALGRERRSLTPAPREPGPKYLPEQMLGTQGSVDEYVLAVTRQQD